MHDIWLLQRREIRLESDVQDALRFLLGEGVACASSPDHPATLLVAAAHWHRAFQLLVAENFDVM
jgi:hypothetical protein